MLDAFKVIMRLVIYYDIKLYQMDIKSTFLNKDIDETIHMVQSKNFESSNSKHFICILKKFICGLKQASHQWSQMFNQVITSFDFKGYIVDQCIYLKFSESKFVILMSFVYWQAIV